MTAVIPRPIDVAAQPHLQGVFAPTTSEVDVDDLTIIGELPAEISGAYIRNGPNPRFTPVGSYVYPLDGDGMVHRVELEGGRARYTNRFVRTPALMVEESLGHSVWPGMAGMGWTPDASLVGPALAHTDKDLPGINVMRHAGRLLALGESCPPYLLDPTLTTIGAETFGGAIPSGTTAHPKIDPETGQMVLFRYSTDAPYMTWSVIERDGTVSRATTPVAGIERPAMVHDMALTQRYVVLIIGPLLFTPPTGAGLPLTWTPDAGTRIALVPRDGGAVRWFDTDAFWMWHSANARDVGDGVVVDFVRWDAPNGFAPGHPKASLARLTVGAGGVRVDTLVQQGMEFPRVDDRTIAHEHVVIAAARDSGTRGLINGDGDTLCWYDVRTDDFQTWDAGNLAIGEQCFVPRPGDHDPDHGWWTCIATDRTDWTSRLLVVPASDPSHGPIAQVLLPQRVPAGLHGSWLPTAK